MADFSFPFEYVSGSVLIPGTNQHIVNAGIVVVVRNLGEAEGTVQAIVHSGSFTFDSWGEKDGRIAPGREWVYSKVQQDPSGGPGWVIIRATSRYLVPSVEFRTFERHSSDSRYEAAGEVGGQISFYTYAWFSPGDFAVFRRLDSGALAPEFDMILDRDLGREG